jgi:predicted nucleotidyltransferase
MVRTKEQILEVAEKYGKALSYVFENIEIRLYGSYHNGNPHQDSDIDFAVISNDFNDMDYLLSLKILNRMKILIDDDIEPISLTPQEFLNPPIGSIASALRKSSEVVYKRILF